MTAETKKKEREEKREKENANPVLFRSGKLERIRRVRLQKIGKLLATNGHFGFARVFRKLLSEMLEFMRNDHSSRTRIAKLSDDNRDDYQKIRMPELAINIAKRRRKET